MSTFDEEHCCICAESFVDSPDKEIVTVRVKGLNTLIKFGQLQGDKELQTYLNSEPSEVAVHKLCR